MSKLLTICSPILITFIISVPGCGGSGSNLGSIVDSQANLETPTADLALDIEAMPAPEGIDSGLWETLTRELASQLRLAHLGKITAAAPSGEHNAITDVEVLDEAPMGLHLAWTYVNKGDYDQNSEVNLTDLTPIALYFSANQGDANWDLAQVADGDGNGEVNLADITPIALNYYARVSFYQVFGLFTDNSPGELIAEVSFETGSGEGQLVFSHTLAANTFPNYRVVPVDVAGETGESGSTGGGWPSPFDDLLRATPSAASLGADVEVVFTVGLNYSVGDPISAEIVSVDETGAELAVLGTLVDDGSIGAGDETEQDRTFSYKAMLTGVEADYQYYVARITYDDGSGERSIQTNTVEFLFYDELTEARAEEILNAAEAVQLDFESLVESLPVTEAAAAVLVDLLANPGIPAAGLTESGEGVWWFTAEGIPCASTIYDDEDIIGRIPSASDTSSATADPAGQSSPALPPGDVIKQASGLPSQGNTVGNVKAIVINAFYFSGLRDNGTVRIMRDLSLNDCPKYELDSFEDYSCDLPQFKSLAEYGIVVISSTGDALLRQDVDQDFFKPPHYKYPFEQAQVGIATSEYANKENMVTYADDLKTSRLLIHGKKNYWILPDFIRKYCKDMPNSLVVLNSKHSLINNTMATAFAESGAATLFGHQKYVYRPGYGHYGRGVITNMLAGMTAGEAYDKDQEDSPFSSASEFKMYGSRTLLLADGAYIIYDLGVLGKGWEDQEYSTALDVNIWGEVVGISTDQGESNRAFYWSNGEMTAIPTLGGNYGWARAINDYGQVVGDSRLEGNNQTHAFYWTEEGGIRDLGTMESGDYSSALDINNNGVIVGWSSVVAGKVYRHPVRFNNPGITDIGVFGSHPAGHRTTPTSGPWCEGRAVAVNGVGRITGRTSDYTDDGRVHGFLSGDGGGLALLPYQITYMDDPQEEFYSTMNDLNNKGEIVGGNYLEKIVPGPTGGTGIWAHGSRYTRNFLFSLEPPGTEEWMESNATSINDAGVIVGYAQNHGDGWITQRAYIIPNDKWYTFEDARWLDEFIPCNSGWSLGRAEAISDNGIIVGHGTHNGKERAFIMFPRGKK